MPTISSDQVNYLVWRYFQEEGLALSGYALDKETRASQAERKLSKEVAECDLVKLLLKGMQMVEIESEAAKMDSSESETVAKSNDGAEALRGDADRANDTANGAGTDGKRPEDSKANDETGKSINGNKSDFVVSGLERVTMLNPNEVCQGGVDSAFNTPLTLVIAGLKSTFAYSVNASEDYSVLDCEDTPTCVVPLGLDILGPDQCILVGYGSGSIRQWRFGKNLPLLQSILSPQRDDAGPVLLIRSSPQGTRVATANINRSTVNIWDLNRRQLIFQLEDGSTNDNSGNAAAPGDIAWISGDSTVVVAYASGIAIFRLPNTVPAGNEPISVAPAAWLRGHSKPVSLLAFEQLTQLLASGGDDGRVCIWNAQNSEPVRQLTVGSLTTPVSHASWLGIHLLTATTDGSVRLWDIRSQSLALVAAIDVGEPVYSIDVSNHSPTHIAALTSSGVHVYMLDPQQRSFRLVGEVKADNVQCIKWGSDQSLAVSSKKETVLVRCLV